MSDEEAETEEAEAVEEPEPEDDEQPAIEDDEMADLSAVAEEVQAATEDSPDEDDDGTDEGTGSDDTTTADNGDSDADLSAGTGGWGEMYVSGLSVGLQTAVKAAGGEADGIGDEVESMASDLHLQEHFNEFMAAKGKSEMPPEQALLVGTITLAAMVLLTKTDVAEKALEDADFSL